MRVLVLDVGTTSVRTAIVDDDGHVSHVHQAPLTVRSPNPGEVELDGAEIAHLSLSLAAATLADGGRCEFVGVTNQRATTLVYDPATLEPVGPTLGWQDLRTVIDCLMLQGQGVFVAPNQSATKAQWLVRASGRPAHELRFATLETYLAAVLTRGACFVTDHSNAAINGLVHVGATQWDEHIIDTLALDPAMFPRIVDTIGEVGTATALAGDPTLCALVGDQSASLFGQGGVHAGATKITFGTGAMLDGVADGEPATMRRFDSGCFPVVARSHRGQLTWGVEGIVLSAGTCVDWLRDDLGLIDDVAETEPLANSVASSDGVIFVPALVGLGTPRWDFGARGGFFGLTRGSTRAHLVRAVLEGVAHRGADLVDAARAQTGRPIDAVRVDGGMSANRFLVQQLANAAGAVVEVSAEREATTRGAGLMALVAAGAWTLDDVDASFTPSAIVEPDNDESQRAATRATWARAIERAAGTIPELSAVTF